MYFIFPDDLHDKKHFGVILLINDVTAKRFERFIAAVKNKEDLLAELCCAYFVTRDGCDGYQFETFEDEDFFLSYEEFCEYVKLAESKYTKYLKWKEKHGYEQS